MYVNIYVDLKRLVKIVVQLALIMVKIVSVVQYSAVALILVKIVVQ